MASFLLLGPLEVRQGARLVRIRGTRQQIVLSLLLLNAGRVVPTDRLATAIWDDDPPATARSQVQISISKLRIFLAGLGLPEAISTREPGYLLRVPEESVDIISFARLVADGRQAARRRDPATAVALLRDALVLWRGDALSDIRSRLVRSAALRLDQERIGVIEECVDLELSLGRYREVLGELHDLTLAYPVREKFYSQLMVALYRDGRQADALEVYRRARHVLLEEHGLNPGSSLQALERAILNGDLTTGPDEPRKPPAPSPATEPVREIPRQLPVRARGFIGREHIRRRLRQVLGSVGATSELVVVSGLGGVGKTALAVETAYEVIDCFPDGQLFARLRGGDGQPVAPEQVLGYFLRALGVPPATLPADRGALEGLYRSRLAGQRILILLDDAASAWQVEPLLPAGPGIATMVTSRGPLAGLPNARRFDLQPFSPETSVRLISEVVGAERVAAEPEAAARITELCAHLPLALQIAAAKLSARPHARMSYMAIRLGDESWRLDELSLNGTGVRASIAVSIQALSPSARRLLLILGALGATDFASWVTGPLLDLEVHHGAGVLDELVDARLAEVQAGAGVQARYRLHDLVGVFARELLAAEVPVEERHAALHRLLRCWWFLTGQAHRRVYGGDFTLPRTDTAGWRVPTDVLDELLAEPIRWFESEHTNAMTAVRLAADLGLHDLCCALAVNLVTFFEARAHREHWRETHELALETAIRHANERAEAVLRYSRAGLALVEQRLTEAEADLTAALSWFERAGDTHARGLSLRGLGFIDRLKGRRDSARDRYEKALVDLRSSEDAVGEAHVLIQLAQINVDDGHPDVAEELLREALDISHRLGVRRVLAQARYRLGQLYLDRDDLIKAESEFSAVLVAATAADDPAGKAYALLGMGTVLLGRGDPVRAGGTLAGALAIMRQAGSRVGEGRALLAMAEADLRCGDIDRATQRLDEADTVFTEIGVAGWLEQSTRLRRWLHIEGEKRTSIE